MHVVVIGWSFVVVLMAGAEVTAPGGTLLGALVTLVLYGMLPLGIVLYILATPGRKRLRRQAEADARQAAEAGASVDRQGDAGSQAAGAAITSERKEP